MPIALFYDTETTGLPLFKEPSEDPRQPHLVEAAAVLLDTDTGKRLGGFDLLVRPDGWEIPADMTEIHGITNEEALRGGVEESLVLDALLHLWRRADVRVAHEQSFDARIIRIALKRFGYEEELAEEFRNAPVVCTCWESMPICRIPNKGKAGIKKPKLSEAFEFFTGTPLTGAHRASADVAALIAVYDGIKRHLGADPTPKTKEA